MQIGIFAKPSLGLAALLTLLCASCAKDPEQRPSVKDYSRSGSSSKVGARNLCVFMDGTANDYDSHTNVRRLYELISARRDPKVLCYYDHGVGANELPITGMIGGAGFSKNVSQAYTFLRENYSKERGDKIYMFGFSRGARQVQVLCDLLNECGLAPKPQGKSSYRTGDPALAESRAILREYKNRYERRSKGEAVPPIGNGWPQPAVEFVGNFDCVESMANNVLRIAGNGGVGNGSYQDHKSYSYIVPGNVRKSYHALSLDEERGLYEGIEWVIPARKSANQVIEEVWFAGSHGDVGGGYQNSQSLSAIPLNWMIGKLDPYNLIPGRIRVYYDEKTPATDSLEFPLAGKVLGKIRGNQPRFRQLWTDLTENPAFPGSRSRAYKNDVKPFVHQSVIDRMKSDPIVNADGKNPGEPESYRPNLFEKYYTPQTGDDYRIVNYTKLLHDIQIVPMTR